MKLLTTKYIHAVPFLKDSIMILVTQDTTTPAVTACRRRLLPAAVAFSPSILRNVGGGRDSDLRRPWIVFKGRKFSRVEAASVTATSLWFTQKKFLLWIISINSSYPDLLVLVFGWVIIIGFCYILTLMCQIWSLGFGFF